jgi:hypothetical protein
VQQRVATDVMTTDVITARENADRAAIMSSNRVGAAPSSAGAKKMQTSKVRRLLGTGGSGQPVGIASIADLPHGRPDAAVRNDVIDHVLRRTLWIDTGQVQVHVVAGVVILTGAVGRRTTAAIAARLTAQVPGVVAVVDQVRYDFDDTTLARSRTHRTRPFSAEPFNP